MCAAAAWTMESAAVLFTVCSNNAREMAPSLVLIVVGAAPPFRFSLFLLTINHPPTNSSCQISGLSTFRALKFGRAFKFAFRAPE
jgi:hypothetical protein